VGCGEEVLPKLGEDKGGHGRPTLLPTALGLGLAWALRRGWPLTASPLHCPQGLPIGFGPLTPFPKGLYGHCQPQALSQTYRRAPHPDTHPVSSKQAARLQAMGRHSGIGGLFSAFPFFSLLTLPDFSLVGLVK
jgi:hypothetical protein